MPQPSPRNCDLSKTCDVTTPPFPSKKVGLILTNTCTHPHAFRHTHHTTACNYASALTWRIRNATPGAYICAILRGAIKTTLSIDPACVSSPTNKHRPRAVILRCATSAISRCICASCFGVAKLWSSRLYMNYIAPWPRGLIWLDPRCWM